MHFLMDDVSTSNSDDGDLLGDTAFAKARISAELLGSLSTGAKTLTNSRTEKLRTTPGNIWRALDQII